MSMKMMKMMRTVMVKIRNQNAPKNLNSLQKLACHLKNRKNKLNKNSKNKQIRIIGMRPMKATRITFLNLRRSMTVSHQMMMKKKKLIRASSRKNLKR